MKSVKKKNSLATILSIAFTTIVVLSLLSTYVSYKRLKNINITVSTITKNSLPESARISQINNILKETLYLIERLTNANNQASRRITMEQLKQQDNELTNITGTSSNSLHLNNQINTARKEIEELNELVTSRINNNQRIQQKLNEAYNFQDQIIMLVNQTQSDRHIVNNILLNVIQSISLSNKALNLYRLQPVRQLSKEVRDNLNAALQLIEITDIKPASNLAANIKSLHKLLLSHSGLFNYKIEQLQISGRSRGKGNFLHNLIADISKLSESNFHKVNASIVKNSHETSEQITKQVNWSILLAISVVILLVALIYFIIQKIVVRLSNLNTSVIERIQSKDVKIDTHGQDEISRLARSFVYFAEKVEAQRAQLETLSMTDGLTNLANRRAMDERLSHDIHTAKRGQSSLSILILDIDYFKPYNDFYGHVAGDECLKNVALGLKSIQQRDSDFLARYGGEEFVMLLPTTDKDGVIQVAERILSTINGLKLPHAKSEIADHITVSIGMATFAEHQVFTLDNILNAADNALYQAKKAGRNQYCHADDMPENTPT